MIILYIFIKINIYSVNPVNEYHIEKFIIIFKHCSFLQDGIISLQENTFQRNNALNGVLMRDIVSLIFPKAL